MNVREVSGGREFVARLDHGADWREELESLAVEEGIDAAWFSGMGAVQDAELWYYDQDDFEYKAARYEEPLEVAACVGNISELDDAPSRTHTQHYRGARDRRWPVTSTAPPSSPGRCTSASSTRNWCANTTRPPTSTSGCRCGR